MGERAFGSERQWFNGRKGFSERETHCFNEFGQDFDNEIAYLNPKMLIVIFPKSRSGI